MTRFFGPFRVTLAAALIAAPGAAADEADIDDLLAAIEGNVRRHRQAGMMVFDYYINVDFDKGLATYLVGKRERDKVLSIVCTDNPYAAVWQPAEGTCERFATAGSN